MTESAVGNGPVDAAYNAITKAIGHDKIDIVDFKLDSKGEGADALAQVSVIAEYNGRRFNGIGLATDIVESGVKALSYVLINTHLADQIDQQRKHVKSHSSRHGNPGPSPIQPQSFSEVTRLTLRQSKFNRGYKSHQINHPVNYPTRLNRK